MSKWQKWGPFVLRMVLGGIFIFEGWGKFGNMIGWFGGQPWEFISIVASINFLFVFSPAVWAILATMGELMGGIMILVGFRTRTAALLLGTIMIVAILGLHLPQGHGFSGIEKPLSLLAIAASLLFTGPGRYYLKLKTK